jgi:hypothetical protein
MAKQGQLYSGINAPLVPRAAHLNLVALHRPVLAKSTYPHILTCGNQGIKPQIMSKC